MKRKIELVSLMISFIIIIMIIIIKAVVIIIVIVIIHNLFVLVFDLFKVLASREVILQKPSPCELAHRLMLQRLDKNLKSAYETWLKNNKKNDFK